MREERNERTSSLRAVLGNVAAGFEVVTGRWWLLLVPVLLDLFYWLGPRLSSAPLVEELAAFVAGLPQPTTTLEETGALLEQLAGQTNLFTQLSVPFLGTPALLGSFVAPERAPLTPAVLEIGEPLAWLGAFVTLSVVGLLLGTLYYGLVAAAVRTGTAQRSPMDGWAVRRFVRWLPVYWVRVLMLAAALLLLGVALYVPLFLATVVLSLFSMALGSFVLSMGLAVYVWMLLYLTFALYGILLGDRPVVWALVESVRLVRNNLLPAMIIILLVVAGRTVLSWLWLWADTGNWLTLVSIVGHAFVSTGLVAAMFIFYRERAGEVVSR